MIAKYLDDNSQTIKKNLGKIDNFSDMRQKISTFSLLENIHRIATEVDENEDGAWLSEYKKISHHKNDEDEVFYDEEDCGDQSKILSKTTSQFSNLNTSVSRSNDSFVVNLSSLHLSLNVRDENIMIDCETYNKNLIPFNEETRLKMMEEIKMNHVWMPEDFQVKSDISSCELSEICDFLKTKGQNGAYVDEILKKFQSKTRQQLHENMETLITLKRVLRTGVNEIRFVHRDFAAFWLIGTFYLTAKDSEDTFLSPPKKKQRTESSQNSQNTDNEEIPMEIDEQITNAEKTFESKEQSEYEKNLKRNPFFLLPCPWIRVGSLNRTLNRRCLDKWLGTILNFLTINQGILLSDLCSKFDAITPVHVRNLCEILQAIGCIEMMAFSELNVTIFSDYDTCDDGEFTLNIFNFFTSNKIF